jgi:hypothetical protein
MILVHKAMIFKYLKNNIFYYLINLPCPIYAKVSLAITFSLPYLCIINYNIFYSQFKLKFNYVTVVYLLNSPVRFYWHS